MKEKAIKYQSLKEYGFVMKSIYEVCETVTDYVAAGSFADLKKNVEYLSEPNYAQLIRTVDLKSGFSKGNFVYVSKKAFDYLWRVNLNCESIILPNIGNCGEVYYVVPEKLPYKNNVLATNAILVRSLKENNKYLYYIFQSKQFQDELKKITSPVGQTKFNKTELKNIYIPITSRKVQEEIVKILDSFTNLIDALNEELSLRQKQFEYYREKLLTFDDNVNWDLFDNIGEITDYVANGSFADLKKNVKYLQESNYAILVRTLDLSSNFKNNNFVYIDKNAYDFLEKSKLFGGEIIINNVGAGVGTVFYCPKLERKMSLGPNSVVLKTDYNKFYYYWLSSKQGQDKIFQKIFQKILKIRIFISSSVVVITSFALFFTLWV